MKKLWGIVFFSCLFCFQVEAKKLDPVEYAPMYNRIAKKRTNKIFDRINQSRDGYITLDQYTNQKLTRGERREMRREMKEGIYKSPEEEFMQMDKNEDGKVDYDEMRNFQTYKTQLRYGG